MKIKLTKELWDKIGNETGWKKTAQNLETVKTPEKFTDRELTRAIRDAMIAENEAIKQYETVVDATDNEKVKKTLQSIADEERVHIFELQELLNILLPEEKDLETKGKQEVLGKDK
jgi:uncharacterized protein